MENERNLELLEKIKAVKAEISKAVLGKEKIVDTILTTIIAGGHILLEDIPGVGKTTLALALSKATSLNYQRLQFTPDVLPTDVTGFSVYDKKTDSFVYKPGAALCNFFLADEINRTSSKTQSALLEIMEEGNVTVDGVTRQVPQPYTVIATQNPIGYIGTQMLPESQLDRFMVRLSMGYPAANDELHILKGRQGRNPLESVQPVASGEDILEIRKAVSRVFTDDRIYAYIVALAYATRNEELLSLGLSPRGSVALANISRARAFMCGRDYVTADDVTDMFLYVAAHRVSASPKARIAGLTVEDVLKSILKKVECPGIN